jgi:hypothetical protein
MAGIVLATRARGNPGLHACDNKPHPGAATAAVSEVNVAEAAANGRRGLSCAPPEASIGACPID